VLSDIRTLQTTEQNDLAIEPSILISISPSWYLWANVVSAGLDGLAAARTRDATALINTAFNKPIKSADVSFDLEVRAKRLTMKSPVR